MINTGHIYNDLHLPDDEIIMFRKHKLLSEFYIDWAGQFDETYNNHTQDRSLREHLLLYCYDGKGDLYTQGEHYEIVPGMLFFLAAGTKHTYGNVEGGYWSGYWVHFNGTDSDMLAKSCFIQNVEVLKIGNVAKLQELYEDILNSLRIGHSLDNALHAANALRYMMSYIHLVHRAPVVINNQVRRINDIIAYMGLNVRKSLNLEQLAAMAYLSKYQFIHCFKKHIGLTPMHYFTMLRIKQACIMLIQKDMNVQEISSHLGFKNPFYFSTVFKRITGCAPSEYTKLKNGSVLEFRIV